MLDEIIGNEIPKVLENKNDQQYKQRVPQTPSSVVRISTRLIRPPKWYSPSFYYALLIDSGELERLEEAI